MAPQGEALLPSDSFRELRHRGSCVSGERVFETMTGVITLGLLPGQSIEISGIDADNPWNRTGLLLECGVRYRFEVVSCSGWRDGDIETDPDGYSSAKLLPFIWLRRHPFAPWMKLIGSVGTTVTNYFPIGNGCTKVAPASGELYCFANDASFRYKNNDGRLTLKVTREE